MSPRAARCLDAPIGSDAGRTQPWSDLGGNRCGSFRRGVYSVLLDRARAPGAHPDSRVALFVEGGGMRGLVSGGMLVALADHGLLQSFDCVYGVSAGALSAAYCLSGQIERGLALYLDHLRESRFLSFRRGLCGELFDLDLLARTILAGPYALDMSALRKASIPIYAVVLDLRASAPIAIPLEGTTEDIVEVLRATITLAGCTAAPQGHKGSLYADAAVLDPLGLDSARHDPWTHAVVLLSRPASQSPASYGLFERLLLRWRLSSWPRQAGPLIEGRGRAHREAICRLRRLQALRGSAVSAVEPRRVFRTFETSRRRLEGAFAAGYDAAKSQIAHSVAVVEPSNRWEVPRESAAAPGR